MVATTPCVAATGFNLSFALENVEQQASNERAERVTQHANQHARGHLIMPALGRGHCRRRCGAEHGGVGGRQELRQ